MMNLNQLYDVEQFEKYEAEIYIYHKIIQSISKVNNEHAACEDTYEQLRKKYNTKLELAQLRLQQFLQTQKNKKQLLHKVLSLHALGIEKQYLKEMYSYNEVPEYLYHYLHQKKRETDFQSKQR
ncbi:MAG: hypothetical protein H6765_08930 [Candidatus Peribacteria bacterium]|nr:MAG: hypothetical protein H6765_08930 [Candidatus Peribacteria bacterium]